MLISISYLFRLEKGLLKDQVLFLPLTFKLSAWGEVAYGSTGHGTGGELNTLSKETWEILSKPQNKATAQDAQDNEARRDIPHG